MWIQDGLAAVETSYWQNIWEQRIILHDRKLILLKPIFQNVRFISLIIVPTSLRRNIFSHYHSGPIRGHMVDNKSILCLRLRFFLPGLRKDIKEWDKGCAHCVAHNFGGLGRSNCIFHGQLPCNFTLFASIYSLLATSSTPTKTLSNWWTWCVIWIEYLFYQSFGI